MKIKLQIISRVCMVLVGLLVVNTQLALAENPGDRPDPMWSPVVTELPVFSSTNHSLLNIQEVSTSTPPNIFPLLNGKLDYNKDGTIDRLVCDNSTVSVRILDGTNPRNILYQWEGPERKTITDASGVTSKRIFTKCVTAEFEKGLPSIVISSAFDIPGAGLRGNANQIVLLNTGNGFQPRVIKFENGNEYTVASRSVKCTQYPEQMVRAGFNPGILCFFAGYDAQTPNGYGTKTALLKIEKNGNTIVAKDITGSAGLPWYGGAQGTPMHSFTIRPSAYGRKYDGLHMMDSAWLEFTGDTLPDLITVGQHASIRASQMIFDQNRSEGIRFTTNLILQANYGVPTEFLTVTAFNEFNKQIKLPCIYVSGELNLGDVQSVPDHIWCKRRHQSTWHMSTLPGNAFSSEIFGAVIHRHNGGIFLYAPDVTFNAGAKVINPTRIFNISRITNELKE